MLSLCFGKVGAELRDLAILAPALLLQDDEDGIMCFTPCTACIPNGQGCTSPTELPTQEMVTHVCVASVRCRMIEAVAHL